MINGDVQDFVNRIDYGDELISMYRGKKYFPQGLFEKDGKCATCLDRWEMSADDYIWIGEGDSRHFPVEEFLKQKPWDGRAFWEAESEMEWMDD